MNMDPVKLREIRWRRPLTAAEQRAWQAWLATHPDAQAEAELDAALDAALERRSPPVAATNFTARVLQTIAAEAQPEPVRAPAPWWRWRQPRLGFAAVMLVAGGAFWYWQHENTRREELAAAARQIATARTLSHPAVIEDFEVIRGLSPTLAAADEGLLALSDDLLALEK